MQKQSIVLLSRATPFYDTPVLLHPVILFIVLPISVQWAGYKIAGNKGKPAIRWIVFWASMILYYGGLMIAYQRDMAYHDAQTHCSMWTLAYFMLGMIGLCMPLTQLVLSLAGWWKK